jgi:hypothetical protein
MDKKDTTMTIDPAGKGTTGICLVSAGIVKFLEYQNNSWEEHLEFIVGAVKKWKPEIIVYETTNYVHKKIPGTLTLLKLIGGIVGIKYSFDFIKEVGSIAVNQVKPFKDKLFTGREQLENLTCKVGRSKGWKYQRKKISLHQLDALIVYHLWSKGSLESKKSIKKKLAELRAKKRLGTRQKEEVVRLEKLLHDKKK